MSTTCKNFEKCPVYSGVLKDKAFAAAAYRRTYCDAGEPGWRSCKRFLVKERTGQCPPDLLPNASASLEQILVDYGIKGS